MPQQDWSIHDALNKRFIEQCLGFGRAMKRFESLISIGYDFSIVSHGDSAADRTFEAILTGPGAHYRAEEKTYEKALSELLSRVQKDRDENRAAS